MPYKKRSKFNYYLHKYFLIPIRIFRIAIIDTVRQDGVEHAGYLAFLILLSLFPFLIFLIAIIGVFGESEAGAQIVQTILAATPTEMSQALAPRINEIISGPENSLLTIAIIGVIWTASSSVEGCRTILNRAYRIATPPSYLWRRMFSIIEFFAITFIIVSTILVFVVVPTLLKEIETKFAIKFIHFDYDMFYIRQIATLLFITLGTSMLYYALPNTKQKIAQTIPGSILAVILWVILQHLFSFYLNNFHQVNFVYGSLAGIIISMMFFYLISLIFIVGAEFNYHFHRAYQVFLKKG